jgi:lactate permease
MQPLLALLPILLFVGLLVGLRLSAANAGLVSAATCLALTYFAYPGAAMGLLGPLLEAGFTALSILWIILPALAIHEYQTRSGATDTLAAWLSSISDRPQVAALLVAWFFALFLEGAAGFGTPVALAAPLLVAVGFSPERALVMALLGHAAGASFGAVGTPILPLLAAAPLDPRTLAAIIVGLHAAVGFILPGIVFYMARPQAASDRARWYWVPLAGALYFVPAGALAWFLGPELPTLGGALFGLLLFAVLAKRAQTGDLAKQIPAAAVVRAALPYLLVLLVVLATRLPQPIAETLRSAALTWRLGAFGGSVAPLYHPGTMLMAGLLAAAAVSRHRVGYVLGPSLAAAMSRLPAVGARARGGASIGSPDGTHWHDRDASGIRG